MADIDSDVPPEGDGIDNEGDYDLEAILVNQAKRSIQPNAKHHTKLPPGDVRCLLSQPTAKSESHGKLKANIHI